MNKFKDLLILAVSIIALVSFLLMYSSKRESDKLVRMKVEAEERVAEIESQVDALEEENAELEKGVESQKKTITALSRSNSMREREIESLRSELSDKVVEVASLEIDLIAESTASLLSVPIDSIIPTNDGLLFSEDSSRTNLSFLLMGEETRKELFLTQEINSSLKEQLDASLDMSESLERIIENKDSEALLMSDKWNTQRSVLEQEIKAERARSRKKQLMWALVGFVGGAVVVSK